MMAMLRGFSVTVGALWLVEAGFAVVAGVNLLAGALGSGGGAGDLAGGAAVIAVGWLSGFVGRKLVRWHPERSG